MCRKMSESSISEYLVVMFIVTRRMNLNTKLLTKRIICHPPAELALHSSMLYLGKILKLILMCHCLFSVVSLYKVSDGHS